MGQFVLKPVSVPSKPMVDEFERVAAAAAACDFADAGRRAVGQHVAQAVEVSGFVGHVFDQALPERRVVVLV